MSKMRFSLARLRLCIEDSVGLVLAWPLSQLPPVLRFHNFKADRLHIHSRNWDRLGYLPPRTLAETFSRVGGATEKTRPKNCNIKPHSTLSVSCIQGATAPLPPAATPMFAS